MDVLDRDAVEDELEVVDGAYDGGVEAVSEDLGGEGVRVSVPDPCEQR